MYIFVLKIAAPDAYLAGSRMLLKLLLFEAADCYGSHFEKTGPKSLCVILHVFLSNRGSELAKAPEFFHGNKMDILFGQTFNDRRI